MNQRRAVLAKGARVYPVGMLRWRRQDRNLIGLVPDGLVVDRRRPMPVLAPPAKPPRRKRGGHAH